MEKPNFDPIARNNMYKGNLDTYQYRVQTNVSKLYLSPYLHPKNKSKKKKSQSCDIDSQVLGVQSMVQSLKYEDLVTPRRKYSPSIGPLLYQKIQAERKSNTE